jgi:hypothetical protein
MAESRSWVEIVLMPLAVALVGTLGTYFITAQQQRSAELKAVEDRQIKILEIFADNITSNDEGERIFALRLLEAVDDDLAERLATAVSATEQEPSAVRSVATAVAQNAAARASAVPRIYIHIRDNSNRANAQSVASSLVDAGYFVPGIERLVDQGPASNQLRYFRKDEEATAKAIVEKLNAQQIEAKLTYIGGYENSSVIKPLHFELWFALGQP